MESENVSGQKNVSPDSLSLKKPSYHGGMYIALSILAIIFGFFPGILITTIDLFALFFLVQLFLGIFLLIMGIWLKVRPNRYVLLCADIGLCILGVWDLVFAFQGILLGLPGGRYSGQGTTFYGILFLVWSIALLQEAYTAFGRSYRKRST